MEMCSVWVSAGDCCSFQYYFTLARPSWMYVELTLTGNLSFGGIPRDLSIRNSCRDLTEWTPMPFHQLDSILRDSKLLRLGKCLRFAVFNVCLRSALLAIFMLLNTSHFKFDINFRLPLCSCVDNSTIGWLCLGKYLYFSIIINRHRKQSNFCFSYWTLYFVKENFASFFSCVLHDLDVVLTFSWRDGLKNKPKMQENWNSCRYKNSGVFFRFVSIWAIFELSNPKSTALGRVQNGHNPAQHRIGSVPNSQVASWIQRPRTQSGVGTNLWAADS